MQRVYGIDVLRVLSMFMVFMIHNLGQGGVLHEDVSKSSFYIAWILENSGIVAVNLFALITGYLLVNRTFKVKRIWDVVVQASFWAPVMVAIMVLIGADINFKIIIRGVAPIIFQEYWYVSAYIGMMLFSPFVNIGINTLSKNQMTAILCGILMASGSIGFIGQWFLLDGYSCIWLLTMYGCGGYIKKYINNIQNSTKHKLFIVSLLMCVVSLVAEYYATRIGVSPQRFISYVSPFVIIQSVSLFVSFKELKISPVIGEKLRLIGNLTFGAYLINASCFYDVLRDRLSWTINYDPLYLVGAILGITVAMYVVMLFMEFIRQILFNKTGVNRALDMFYYKLQGYGLEALRIKAEI